MNACGQFGRAFGVSLAVHSLALAAMAWLGAFTQKPPAVRLGLPPAIAITLVSEDEVLPPEPSPKSLPSAPLALEPEPTSTDTQPTSTTPPTGPLLSRGPTPVDSSSIVPVPSEALTYLTRVERAGRGRAEAAGSTSSSTNAFAEGTLAEAKPASGGVGPGDVGGNDSDGKSIAPTYRRNPPPRYPAAARRRGEQGVVLLQVLVDERGRPARVNVTVSSDSEALDSAASGAVRGWEFEPARRQGRPVAREVQVPIRFALEYPSAQ